MKKKKLICINCHEKEHFKLVSKTGMFLELFLFALAIIIFSSSLALWPIGVLLMTCALITSNKRYKGRLWQCKTCGSNNIIPQDTPKGIQILNQVVI